MILPTKNNIKEEIEHRITLLKNEIEKIEKDDNLLLNVLQYELTMYIDMIELLEVFNNRIGFDEFEKSKYTPIKCIDTGEPILIGDFVDNKDGRCGQLQFDDYLNKYVIKDEHGGNIHTPIFRKISKRYDFTIDAGRVECRSPNRYLKRRW